MSEAQQHVQTLVEHLFRHEAARMLSALARQFGLENLDLAEEVVQEAMLAALRLWPFRGIPDNPSAWLTHVARNKALDIVRRRRRLRRDDQPLELLPSEVAMSEAAAVDLRVDGEVADDQLAMIFACCHPALSADARVALTLKAACGFSVVEIARAFLAQEATIAQRLVRAKRQIAEEGIAMSIPPAEELSARIDSVLHAVYLLFNEGYSAHQGEDLIRQDLCGEAIRLCHLLLSRPASSLPKVHALLSLLCLQASRLPARVDTQGNLLLLSEQDRSQWDERLVYAGLRHLDSASAGDELTEYHIQAAIATIHAAAASYAQTDWPRLLILYDSLNSLAPSPVVSLNRAVALSMVEGPLAGLTAVEEIRMENPPLCSYYLLPATQADLLLQLGRRDEAASCYREALQAPCTDPERRFLQRRLEECR